MIGVDGQIAAVALQLDDFRLAGGLRAADDDWPVSTAIMALCPAGRVSGSAPGWRRRSHRLTDETCAGPRTPRNSPAMILALSTRKARRPECRRR